jgi:enoyl-CoA hydratase/carnithine racemase
MGEVGWKQTEEVAMKDGRGVTRRDVLAATALGASAVSAVARAAQFEGAAPPVFETLAVETRGPVCVIRLNRPAEQNIVDQRAMRELPLAWNAFAADDNLKVAIFTGAGDQAFCGGVDVGSIRAAAPAAFTRRDEGIRSYTAKQNRCWKPVIAAINGFVAGPGLHFLLDADICITVPDATFFDVHMHCTGSVPVIEPIEMARKIPHEAVSRLFLLGPNDPLSAERALRLGLVSEIVPRASLMARAMEMAQQISQLDMHLTTAFLESLHKARELGVTEAINRGLIIRQATGYRDAPLRGRSLVELARPGSE